MPSRNHKSIDVQNVIDLLTSPAAQDFILAHQNEDIHSLILKNKSVEGIPAPIMADQIAGRRKAFIKAPGIASIPGVVFPPAINLEQSSSEVTAKFKADILRSRLADHDVLVDLTGGFGIDSHAFAKVFRNVISVDPDVTLNQMVRHNFSRGQLTNIKRLDMDAAQFLKANNSQISCFFADPSRRVNTRKVAALTESEPDVVSLRDSIFSQSEHLLIKTSPLLDISMALSQLEFVTEVFVLAIDNECRELLFFCSKGKSLIPNVHAVNISTGSIDEFSFTYPDERNAVPTYGEIRNYIYEPNAAILKAGAFKLIAARFNLMKLARHTHFYTSTDFLPSFPGRVFQVEFELKSDSRAAAKALSEGKANIISRNYPLDVAGIRTKLKIKEGGDRYVIATATENWKGLVVCSRLK